MIILFGKIFNWDDYLEQKYIYVHSTALIIKHSQRSPIVVGKPKSRQLQLSKENL